jgi:hypothetical protein
MFERFNEPARQVVVLAQEEARTLKHNYLGTEHILLGLLREEEGLAAQALESLDITVDRVRAQVVRIVGSGEEVTSGPIPFTPRAKKVLELDRCSSGIIASSAAHSLRGGPAEHPLAVGLRDRRGEDLRRARVKRSEWRSEVEEAPALFQVDKLLATKLRARA